MYRVQRTRAVLSKKEFRVSVPADKIYTTSKGEKFVSRTTLSNMTGMSSKESMSFLNALTRGKIRSSVFFDVVFIPLEKTMATPNSSIILCLTEEE